MPDSSTNTVDDGYPWSTFDEWLAMQRKQDGGTHWSGCFASHPGCAAIIATEREQARVERIIEDHVKFCRMDGRDAAASEIEYLLAAIRKGDDA